MFNKNKKLKKLLEEARNLLPTELSGIKDKTYCNIENYKEFLSNGEYELAMEQLEGIGEEVNVSSNFWECLLKIADLMQLEKYKIYYKNKLK